MHRLRVFLATWPSPEWLVWFDRRLGLYWVTTGALVGLKWRNGYDLNAFLAAGRDVAAGRSPYDATTSVGVAEWGTRQVFVSPPFVAHLLAPVSGVPSEVVFAGWSIVSLIALAIACRLVDADTTARRLPRLMLGMAYLSASVLLGQVNLFVLAGLLVALGCRRAPLAGAGLALAVLLRATPVAFVTVLVVEGRWRSIGWAIVWVALGVAMTSPPEWLTFIGVLREASGLPTLQVIPQASVDSFAPALWSVAAIAIALVIVLAVVRATTERPLLVATAMGTGLVLLPTNSWYHWYSFALVGLFLWGDQELWSRRALIGFAAAGYVLNGVAASIVALGTTGAMLLSLGRSAVARSAIDRIWGREAEARL